MSATVTGRPTTQNLVAIGAVLVGLVASVLVHLLTSSPSLWGLLPIAFYAVLVLIGVNIILATGGAIISAAILTGTTPLALGDMLAESLGSFLVLVGFIVLLGAGLGEVAARTGAAHSLVHGVMSRIGLRTQLQVQIGVMVAGTALSAMLGTMVGATAVLATVAIPLAAKVRLSPPAVAAMFHAGGAAGLFVGPFTPPVVTITGVTDISYAEYLLKAGGPMALATWITGFFMARWIQRRYGAEHHYSEEDLGEVTGETKTPTHARAASIAFVVTLAGLATIGIIVEATASYIPLVMIVTAAVTGLAGRLGPTAILDAMYAGGARMLWLVFLFWLFDPFLILSEQTGGYEALLDVLEPMTATTSVTLVGLVLVLVGWLGISGAAVAQVTLMDKLFAPLAASLGINPGAWSLILLASSQIDWFGPFPGPDMVAQMGLARSRSLRLILYNGWAIMVANVLMLVVLIPVLT
ncbi:hypothetical protein MU582_00440 [Nocardioidaceae bacterium SCSIO 66511]|nr:hypothetical protein MU582_00440 [Nocardioidaceae bacterium SCSIO 66511]